MPQCCVPGCFYRSESKKIYSIKLSFYRFPSNEKEKKKWLQLIRRENFTPNCNSRVCSWHFPNGKAAGPSRFAWNTAKTFQIPEQLRLTLKQKKQIVPTSGENEGTDQLHDADIATAQTPSTSKSLIVLGKLVFVNKDAKDGPNGSVVFTPTDSTQTSISSSAHPQLHSVYRHQDDHDYCLTAGGGEDETDYFTLQNDVDALRYTGIALQTFNILVSTLERYASDLFTLPVRDQVLMTLMKLKTNRVISDLSRQFHVSQSMANIIISYWIDKLEEFLQPLVPWLPSATIQATMPAAFKKDFPNTTCIVNCSESHLQKPQNLDSREESYGHYHNTVKYLVAFAPCGLIMFVSEAYGGRCNAKFITMDSGILDKLKPGDEIMADSSFTIKDLLSERKVKLAMPSFTNRHGQLTEEQATCSTQITQVRIHVEQVIGRLKVYKILSQVVPITMAAKIDKIVKICAALVNLRENPICDSY
ncbi:hypothetical protein PAMP_020399 [Pampus punctatissimus]